MTAAIVQLRAKVDGALVTYFFSTDEGRSFHSIGDPVPIRFSWWKGARPAIFAYNTNAAARPTGFVDVDWFHYQALPSAPGAAIADTR